MMNDLFIMIIMIMIIYDLWSINSINSILSLSYFWNCCDPAGGGPRDESDSEAEADNAGQNNSTRKQKKRKKLDRRLVLKHCVKQQGKAFNQLSRDSSQVKQAVAVVDSRVTDIES